MPLNPTILMGSISDLCHGPLDGYIVSVTPPCCEAWIFVYPNVRIGSDNVVACIIEIVNHDCIFVFPLSEMPSFFSKLLYWYLSPVIFTLFRCRYYNHSNVTEGKLAIRLPISLASFLIVTLLQDNIIFWEFLNLCFVFINQRQRHVGRGYGIT